MIRHISSIKLTEASIELCKYEVPGVAPGILQTLQKNRILKEKNNFKKIDF